MEILSFCITFALKSPSSAFLSSSPMIPRASRGVGCEWGGENLRKKVKVWGFNPAAPKITVHGAFLVFLQNYSFATTLSNSVYKTTLRFFDVLDSFLMLF